MQGRPAVLSSRLTRTLLFLAFVLFMILWGSRLRTSLNWWTTDLFPEPGQPMRPVEESPAAMSPSSSSQFSMCSTPTPSSSSPPSPSSSSSSSSSSTSETSGRRPHSSDNQRERKLQEHRTRARPTPAMSVCLMLLVSWVISVPPGSLVLARRHRDERKLAMWIDENQVKALTGRAGSYTLHSKTFSAAYSGPAFSNPAST